MTWETAGAVALAALGIAGSLAGLAWTLGRIFRPWMREAARDAADSVSAEVKALGDKLATNDFPHVEARIDLVEAHGREDRKAMEDRIGNGLAALGERIGLVESHGREERAAMEEGLGGRIERMEGRLLDAIRGRAPEAEAPK